MKETKYAIGVDIGGTLTKFGIVDQNGNILQENTIVTNAYKHAADFVDALCENITHIMTPYQGASIVGVGIGAPNANFHTGAIDKAANLPWKELIPLREMVIKRLKMYTVVTNDANAAALGEMQFGAAKNIENFILITLGTGVGSGIVANGQLIYGCDGLAGEVGHIIAIPEGRDCGCGRKGCLETYASATGVMITARETAREHHLTPFENSRSITKAALQGDPFAIDIFNRTGKILGNVLANVATITNPEAIIFFGGLANAGDFLIVPTQKAYEESLLFIYKNKTRFLLSDLQHKNAAILGAAALVF